VEEDRENNTTKKKQAPEADKNEKSEKK